MIGNYAQASIEQLAWLSQDKFKRQKLLTQPCYTYAKKNRKKRPSEIEDDFGLFHDGPYWRKKIQIAYCNGSYASKTLNT